MNKKEANGHIRNYNALLIKQNNLQNVYIKEVQKIMNANFEIDCLSKDIKYIEFGIETIKILRRITITMLIVSLLAASMGNILFPIVIIPLSIINYFANSIPVEKALNKYKIKTIYEQRNVFDDLNNKIVNDDVLIKNSTKAASECSILIEEIKEVLDKEALMAIKALSQRNIKLSKIIINHGRIKKKVRKVSNK